MSYPLTELRKLTLGRRAGSSAHFLASAFIKKGQEGDKRNYQKNYDCHQINGPSTIS